MITNSTIDKGSANLAGGILMNSNSDVTLTGSTISNNTSTTSHGGGI